LFSTEIVKKVKEKGGFPSVLDVFPKEGMIPNTEKYILRNFMGYGFLHDGFLINYLVDGLEFDCFLIEGKNPADTENMLKKYLEAKNKQKIHEISLGYRIEDRYYHNIYISKVNNYICGVMKIKEGFEKTGEKYLTTLTQNLKNK
jgi:hypothetical protein